MTRPSAVSASRSERSRAPLRLVAPLALALPAACMAATLDVPGTMAALDGATVATVVLVPPMAVFRAALDQGGLQREGCHYTTDDQAAIRRLVGLLKAADLTVNPVYQRPDIREGVYLTLPDGNRFSVLLADNAGGRLPVPGIAETTNGSTLRTVSVSARSTLAVDVRAWARQRSGTAVGSACDLQAPVAADPQAPPAVPR